MQITDLENQSLVGTVMVLDAVVTVILTSYLKSLPADERGAVHARIVAQVDDNGRQLMDLAPKAQVANALKIQAAAARMVRRLQP